jgi:hypothetical protein
MGAIDTAKEIAGLVQKYNDVPLMKHIVELQTEVVELVQQNREKDQTIEKLKRAMELKGKVVCEHSAYYEVNEHGEKVSGPFCTNCFDNEHAPRRLVQGFKPKNQNGHNWCWVQCPKCKVPFRSEYTGKYLVQH